MLHAAILPILRLFSSVTFGIVLMALLFVYMTIGSAGILYPVHPNVFHPDSWVHAQMRQWRPFEMTEFEWFHWWPFNLLVGLIALTLVVTTIRRIPFKPVNYGVWGIHSGVIVLILGSVWYFGSKVEGEAPVPRRAVRVTLTTPSGTVEKGEMLAMPGIATTIGKGSEAYDVQIRSIDPTWELLSGPDKGKRAYSVNLLVQSPSKRFMRQVIAGYPQYTEDMIFTEDPKQPVKRAVKETGKPLVDETLAVELAYESQGWYYLKNDLNKSWALYVRQVNERGEPLTQWSERPMDGMPLYNDCIPSNESVFGAADSGLTPHPIDVAIPPAPGAAKDDPLAGITFECTGFVRYAQMRARWDQGTEQSPPNPVVAVSVRSREGVGGEYRLVASDPMQRTAVQGVLALRSITDEAQLAALMQDPTLVIKVPDANIELRERVTDILSNNPSAQYRPIGPPDSGYSYRVASVQDDLPISGREYSVAILELRTPKGEFRRWVFDDPSVTRDIAANESAAQAVAHGPQHFVDPTIRVEYLPGNRLSTVTLVAGPDPSKLRVIDAMDRANPEVLPVAVGQPRELAKGAATMVVTQFLPRAVQVVKPYPMPQAQRNRDAKELFSMALLRIKGAGAGQQALPAPQWARYHPYVFDRPEEVLHRYSLRPTTFVLAEQKDASGVVTQPERRIEVLFSRQRLPLPTAVALDDFVLTTHVGGFSGSNSSIRNYTSVVRFQEPSGTWGTPLPLSVNEPVEHGGMWFFQSQWDPPDEAREGGLASAGLNYTVLGVGTRHGVGLQLAGCILAVLGMAYAFYIKPVVRRRHKEGVLHEIAAAKAEGRAPHFDHKHREREHVH